MAQVILKKVDKIYPNGLHAVRSLSLEIRDGEFMVLVGPSGCAKSTTLNMIAGLEEISRGEIWIGEKLVNDLSPKDRDIAMVFQSYALYPHMNVHENMAFGLKLRKLSNEEIKKRVNDAAHILGITDLLSRKPKSLSGGQRQRVAVGRAIVRKPKVFLFDEPLSNLDANLRVHMRVELARLHQKLNTTMIYVTHDQTEAMTMGDRICIMDSGLIKQVDVPVNLYNKPANRFVATFIGSPSMNILKVTLIKEGEGIYAVTGDNIKIRLPEDKAKKVESYLERDVWLGIRPEDIGSRETHPEEKDNYIQSKVNIVEQMGNEVFVYLTTGIDQYIARLDSGIKAKSGDNYELWFDMTKCHIFDMENEKNITL